jgi:hypothetical protein
VARRAERFSIKGEVASDTQHLAAVLALETSFVVKRVFLHFDPFIEVSELSARDALGRRHSNARKDFRILRTLRCSCFYFVKFKGFFFFLLKASIFSFSNIFLLWSNCFFDYFFITVITVP